MISKILRRGLVLALVCPFLVGCVSYQQYRKTAEELERAKEVNRDLIAKYNRDINGRTPTTTTFQGVSPAKYAALESDYAKVRKELDAAKNKLQAGFTREEAEGVIGSRFEEGGIALTTGLLFNAGESQLKELSALDSLAGVLLSANHAGSRFLIEVHTDNQPLVKVKKLYEYNINLGYKRAYSVFKYLTEKRGIPEERFRIVSYGMTKPLNPAVNSESGRAENRRVVIRPVVESM